MSDEQEVMDLLEAQAERAKSKRKPQVRTSAWRCGCGNMGFIAPRQWLASGDTLQVTCGACGTVTAVRFLPETVTP